MNQKELNEIRRRFKLDKNAISRMYGYYVNNNKDIISSFDTSLGLISEEEQEMYLTLLKKALSGGLGRNLVDIEFSTEQVADSEEHTLLQTLRKSALADDEARETLVKKLVESMDMGETNYLILLAADLYDVPNKGADGEIFDEGSDTVYDYFVCSVCPVKMPKLELRYIPDETWFHSASTGYIVSPPEMGFLYPAFDNRATNIYNALFYTKKTDDNHQEVIDAIFNIEPPMSAEEQKMVFTAALGDTLEQDCSYDVVQAVHEQIREKIVEHTESKDPEPLTMTIPEVSGVLRSSGVPAEKVEAFEEECQTHFGEHAELNPKNIIESNKFQITTPEVKIAVAPEYSSLVETRVIDGRKYILVPAGDGVEINGIDVSLANLDDAVDAAINSSVSGSTNSTSTSADEEIPF